MHFIGILKFYKEGDEMDHGGDLISYESFYDGELVDFSSNINPLGPPKGLDKYLVENFNSLKAYPDIQYRKLKQSISEYLNCGVENIIVGNGAVEIINNATIIANRVIITSPSFSEYEKRAIVHKKTVVRIPYKEDFTVDLNAIKRQIKKRDLLILGNPNNPTGLRIEKKDLLEIYSIIIKANAYLLLDEAFFEFSPKDYDSIEIFKSNNYDNLVIIRAATKFFALPGIRLGYGCTSTKIVEKLRDVELPWSINSLADAAGQYILLDKEYIKKSKRYIEEQQSYLQNQLGKINGIIPYKTHTNYILIKLAYWDQEYVFDFFLTKGIVIRKCSSFEGLSNEYIRVAIKDKENNDRLIKAFQELTAKVK